jgi:nitrogen fixation NifU-like protein
MMVFSEALLEHFERPRNVGEMLDSTADAEEENPVCGDRLHLWLRVEGGVIRRATWKAEGCVPAIASASVMSEMLPGMTVEQAADIDRETISGALGGLPARKAHAAMLAVSTLKKAIDGLPSDS